MNEKTILAAIKEAKEFIKRADAVLDCNEQSYIGSNSKSGALRRQSMELTRALSDMRKP